MANTYKNTKTLNPALRSIGNMNVRGVVKGGTSDADKAERYGLPVMVSETGYIDPSLLEGGGGGGGVTEQRVKELINDNLQPYNDGAEIKADVETKITSANAEVMIADKLQPYADGQAIKDEVNTKQSAAQVESAIADKLQPYNDGQEIKDEVDEKVNTSDYDADFVVFDGEQGATKGEKIKSYIDNISPPAPENVIEKTDMSPYGQTDKTQTGTEIETAIAEKVDYIEFETFESEVGDNIGEKIRSAISGGTSGITESKLSECLSPYSTSSADITEIGTKIKADTDAKVSSDDFDAEFATFDTETGATQGERIKAYIDNHAPSPENAISQQDMSPYGADDKANTGSDIENAISEKVSTDEFDTQFAVFDGETGATKGDKIKAYIDEHGGGGDPTAILQANMSPYGQTDKTQTGAEIAAAIASAGKTDEQIKQLASEQIATEITQGGAIDDAVAEKLDEKFQPYNSGQEIKDAIDAKPDADDVVAVSDMSPFGQTTKQYIGEEIVAKIEDIIAENLDESGDITIEIKDRANSITQTTLSESMSPYSQSVGDISQIGTKIKNDVNLKVNTTDYNADFNNFDAETGDTKGEKIQNYIDDVANEKVDITAMSPYGDNPTQIGVAIQNAITSATKSDDEIKMLAEAKIAEDCEVGGTIDDAINAKIGDNLLEKTDLAPYGQTDKSQTGTEIADALALKADAADVSGKVDTTTYDADFSNFGVSGHSKGENIANYVNSQGALKVDITAMAPFADEPTKIGEAIQEAIDAGGGGGISTETFQQYMSPYGATSASTTGTEIKSGLDAKLSTATFNTEFEAFGQGADTKGELIKNYVDSQMNGKLNISAMDPFISDESDVGQNIADAIDEKLDADTLKTYMTPYGQQDITQLGNDIKEAISAISKTDEEIKELAEAQIVTDVGDGGTIDTAIDNKFTAENVLRQSDLSPFGDDDITETGADIQFAINAVDAKTKTDQQIKDLADTQITTQLALNGSIDTAIKSNAVVPTDLGDFYDDDKTQIGANIKAAIESGGDPDNPTVKQSDMNPYGQSDIADTGADIQREINSAISTALAPFANGEAIVADQQQQNISFDTKLQTTSNSIIPTIKSAFNYNDYQCANKQTFKFIGRSSEFATNNNYYSNTTKLQYYFVNEAIDSTNFKVIFKSYNYETKEENDVFEWGPFTSIYSVQADFYTLVCEDDPSIALMLFEVYDQVSPYYHVYFIITKDGGKTWNKYTKAVDLVVRAGNQKLENISYIFKDKNNNYFVICNHYYYVGSGTNWATAIKLDLDAPLDSNSGPWAKDEKDVVHLTALHNRVEFMFSLRNKNDNKDYLFSSYYGQYAEKDFELWKSNSTLMGWGYQNATDFTTSKYITNVISEYGADYLQAPCTYKINDKLVAIYPYCYIDSTIQQIMLAICDDFENVDWLADDGKFSFYPVKAKNNKLNGITFDKYVYAGNTGATQYPYSDTYKGIILSVQNNLVYLTYADDSNSQPNYYKRKFAVLDLDKKEISGVDIKDLPETWTVNQAFSNTANTIAAQKNSFPLYTFWDIGNYQSESFFIEERKTELDSFKIGDILVTCRNPGESWLECDGSTFSEEDYPYLAELILDFTLPTATPSWITGGTTTFKAYIKAK